MYCKTAHLGSDDVSEVEEDGLDGAVGRVVGGGGGHQLGVAVEEEVHLSQEVVHFDGREELGQLAGDLPETLGGRGGIG